MTNPRWERLKEVFAEAVDKEGEERERFLSAACAGDPGLLEEVQALLAGDEQADGFLSNPVVSLRGGEASPPLFAPGQIIAGRFRTRRFIGRGGMGEVYEAEDLVLAEKVALKTIRPISAAGHGIEHLKQEIHAARRVTHPNVCRTFDIAEHGDPPVTLATAAPARGGGGGSDVAPRSPSLFSPPAPPFPDAKAAYRLQIGIFPDPSQLIYPIFTRLLQSNCLSFTEFPPRPQQGQMTGMHRTSHSCALSSLCFLPDIPGAPPRIKRHRAMGLVPRAQGA